MRQLTVTQKLGASLLVLLMSYAFCAPLISNISPNAQNLMSVLAPPSSEHLFGTDHYGRDMFVRLADALKRSLFMALLCVVTSAVIGVTLGVLAATGPRWVDATLDGFVNILLALPGLVLVLIFAAIVPGSFLILYLGISLIQWVDYFRVTRVIVNRLAQSPEVEASRLLGFNRWYLFYRHYVPAIAPQILTIAAFGAANAILMMSSLGFVSVGIQPPLAELGLMIVEHFPYYSDVPWLLIQPLLALAILVLSFQLLAWTSEK